MADGLAGLSSDGQRHRIVLRHSVGAALTEALVNAQRGKQREQVGAGWLRRLA